MKEKLLYLCHRIPFPANKGDKITTCNILKFLSNHYDIYLGCFIDDPFDTRYKSDVESFCKECFFIDLNKRTAQIKGLSAFVSGKPITLPFYHNKQMAEWVSGVIEKQQIKKAFIYSGCMAQYVIDEPQIHRVIDFADIDSDKWRQYADKTNGIMRWVYKREYKTLEEYEKFVASSFDTSCFISDTETEMFRKLLNNTIDNKIQTLGNGTDCDFFSPSAEMNLAENYQLHNQNYVVFTGAMDYWANVDAVTWFVDSVWPKVKAILPDSYFYIVGSSPTKEVIKLAENPGVIVTGRVDDVRPYLLNAKAAVAPMQIARGIQNKILEAMAMERLVGATSLGIEGIEGYPSENVLVTDSPDEFSSWTIDCLSSEKVNAQSSRKWLQETYSWNAKLSPLMDYLGE
ncbi:TIGR03087 family PEP-CTERM/XrtA system glycosyltransferase [Vibrio sp.]|nr:TIGR03087 family PEP-CTERM/XrtA system glycosyltransferase [Vibrio sp.]